MGKYVATASTRDGSSELEFVVETDKGAKAAWSEARRQCREGAAVQPPESDSAAVAVEAGAYRVRSVYRIDKPRAGRRQREPTARELVEACEANGITVAKKVREQLDQLRRDAGLDAAAEPDVTPDQQAADDSAA